LEIPLPVPGGISMMSTPPDLDEMPARASHQRGGAGRFVLLILLWLLLYTALLMAYNFTYRTTSRVLIHRLQVAPAARILSWLNPSERIFTEGISISSARVRLDLMRGCDGVEAWVILLAAMLVFPMPWRHRLAGVVWGSIVVFGLNLARIVSLYQIALYRPQWFGVAHGLIWQTVMTVAAALFAWLWISALPPAPSTERAP
jgi:exosortase family protein XrtM